MGYKKTYREQTEELPYDFYMQLLKDLLIEKDGAEDSSFENEWENEDDYDDFEDIIEEELPGIDEFRTINQLPFFKEKVETVYQLCKEDRIKDANRICCGLVEAIGIVFLKKKYSVRVSGSHLVTLAAELQKQKEDRLKEMYISINGNLNYSMDHGGFDIGDVVGLLYDIESLFLIILGRNENWKDMIGKCGAGKNVAATENVEVIINEIRQWVDEVLK